MSDGFDVVGPQPRRHLDGDFQAKGFRQVTKSDIRPEPGILERTDVAQADFNRRYWDAGPYPDPGRLVEEDPHPGEAHPWDQENGGCTECVKPQPLPPGLVVSEDGRLLNWQGENYVVQDKTAPSTGNPKDAIGDTKPQMHLVPAALSIEVARAMADGARKYGPYNWRTNPVRMTVYISAIERHVAALKDGENLTRDSKVKHLAAIGANVAILLDAGAVGVLLDDRPTPGPAGDLLEFYTERAA